ncbi:MAG: hypothetical protein AAFV07_19110 [Bacteroidota bacterium]
MIPLMDSSGYGLLGLVVGFYLLAHLPAIITLIIGLVRLKKRPESAKKFLIFAGIYFLVGAGTCGVILSGG